MRIHWLQHADFEDLGCIAPWLEARGHATTRTRLFADERLPELSAFDALIVLGGPMNIYEHARYPWLVPEKAFIADAIKAGKRVLGICLGSQLLADVLGGPTTRNAALEIGWFPLRLTPEGRDHPLFAGLPDVFTGFHWHGDTYALPPGAVRLAESEACAQQAFEWDGSRVLGLQFHLEVTQANAIEWFRHETVTPSKYVQVATQILADAPAFEDNNRWMLTILERFLA